MPNQGRDFDSELKNRLRKVDIDDIPNSTERVLTLTLDFPSINEFKRFVDQGQQWSGSPMETNWLTDQIHSYDTTIVPYKNVPVPKTRTYKETVFDERGMIVIIVRYEVK